MSSAIGCHNSDDVVCVHSDDVVCVCTVEFFSAVKKT